MYAKRGDLYGGNKLRTFALFNQSVQNDFMSFYLMHVKNVNKRRLMSKFRLGVCPLRIETGRYEINEKKSKGISVENRTCQVCGSQDKVEDKFHFLMMCPAYNELRNNLFDALNIDSTLFQSESQLKSLFIELMADYAFYSPY